MKIELDANTKCPACQADYPARLYRRTAGGIFSSYERVPIIWCMKCGEISKVILERGPQ